MRRIASIVLMVGALTVTVPAWAQTQNVKVGGSLDAYWFYRENYNLSKNDGGSTGLTANRTNGDDWWMSITQVQVAADLTDNVSTAINLVNQRDWNASSWAPMSATESSDAASQFDVIIDTAFVQMKEIFYTPLTLKIGRQDLVFGRGFIIGWNPQDPKNTITADEFTAVQSFDAIRATLDFNPWTLDLVYSKLGENSINNEDDRDLYIANLGYHFSEYNAVAEGYFVAEHDRGNLVTASVSADGPYVIPGKRANETDTIGGRVQFDPIAPMTLGAEAAYQFGHYEALTTAKKDRDAWAMDLFGTYRFENPWKPELTLEYVMLSGEADLSDNNASYGAWNGPFRGPTYGWIHEYLETYYPTAQAGDQPASQNMQHVSLAGSILPKDDLKLSLAYYYIWSPETMHIIAADPSSTALSDGIGNELDFNMTYTYTEDVRFNMLACWFFPGDLYQAPNDKTAKQLVMSTSVTF